MATYREMTYMVLDELKQLADDSYYTEEHILFLLSRMRALLLMRKYAAQRTSDLVPSSDYQQLCFDLETTDMKPGICGGSDWLRSTKQVPDLLGIGNTQAFPVSMLTNDIVTFIPPERMPYIGYNKWLRHIIYVAIGTDHYLYVHSANPQFKYMKKMKLNGVFEDADKAAELECNPDGTAVVCDVLDREFPLDEGLQAACIEYVVQELMGSRYAPKDKQNNAEDDMSGLAMSNQAPRVARDSDARSAARAEEAR